MAASNTTSETALLTMRIFSQLKAVHALIHVYFITALLGIIHIRKKKYASGIKKKKTPKHPKATPRETSRLLLCMSHRRLCVPAGLRGHIGAACRCSWSWHILYPGSLFLEASGIQDQASVTLKKYIYF